MTTPNAAHPPERTGGCEQTDRPGKATERVQAKRAEILAALDHLGLPRSSSQRLLIEELRTAGLSAANRVMAHATREWRGTVPMVRRPRRRPQAPALEYRVRYRRDGRQQQTRVFQTRHRAFGFLALLGSGTRPDLAPIAEATLEVRDVEPWRTLTLGADAPQRW